MGSLYDGTGFRENFWTRRFSQNGGFCAQVWGEAGIFPEIFAPKYLPFTTTKHFLHPA
jgi:hypothetical protein